MVLWLGEEGVMCNLYRNVGDVFCGMTFSIGLGGGVVTNWSGWEVKEVTFKDNYYLGGGGGGDFILDLPLFIVYYGVFMVWGGGRWE